MASKHEYNLAVIRGLLAAIPSPFIGLGSDHRVLLWNPPAEQALGCRQANVLGRRLESCGAAWDVTRVLSGLTACKDSRQTVRIEGLRCNPAGRNPVELDLTIISLGEKGLYGVRLVVIGADVTERKRLEAQLVHAQKMQAIGHLAAGIAHEISTPAQFVGDNTHFLRDAFDDLAQILARYHSLAACLEDGRPHGDALRAVAAAVAELDPDYLTAEIPLAVEHILEGVHRISKIVRSMKFFAHPGVEAEMAPLDLNEAIESTIVISRNEWKYVAEVETDLDASLPPVPGRRGEINQVLLNLVTNAAHAIAEKHDGLPGGKGGIHVASRRDGRWAEIRIRDTGAGIPEAVRPKVFDLFFTTKEEGRGSGQGLAIAHSVIVEQHGGVLTFESRPGEGTTFIVRLPLGEEKGP